MSSKSKIDDIRRLRANILKMIHRAGSGHPGGSLSIIDILYVLYHSVMRHDPAAPEWKERDKFILSKGHACPALYAILADCGYFDEKHLESLRQFHGILQGHPNRLTTPGVEVSTGSLGQGLSIAVGVALSDRMDGIDSRVYCLMGDGEVQEGQVWEAVMAASHYGLDHLCGIIDKNELQIDGRVQDVMNIDPLSEKLRSFGWHVVDINGHELDEIEDAFNEASETKGKPTMIVAHTVKGKGVSFMEGVAAWHGRAPDREELERALMELGAE